MRNVPIILLIAAFLVLATLYSAAVPLGEGPDEPGHANYVLFLARAGRLPVQRLELQQTDVAGEGHQPPLAYALAMPPALWLALDQRQIDLIGNPRFTWSGGAEVNAVSHGSREYPPWQSAVMAWHLMRLVSVALGAVTIFFTYLAARAIDFRLGAGQSKIANPKSAIALLAAGLIAFNPQFLFISALVTNDALLTALSAILTWLIVRAGDGRRTEDDRQRVRDAITIGIVLGLALLTKQSAIILIPVALIGAVAWQRRGVPSLRRSALAALTLLATAAVIAGWWYARNQQLYGDLFGLGAFRGEFVTQPFEIGSPAAWVAALAQLHASFWARFGWMNVAPPAWVLWLIGAVELAAVAGLAREWLWGGRPHGDLLAIYWPLLALPALALAWIVSFAVTAGLVAWQGRLLFPALPAVAILLARGLLAWYVVTKDKGRKTKDGDDRSLSAVRPGTRWVPFVAGLVLCPVIGLALWMPGGVIRPAYPQQTLPEAAAQQRLGTPVLARFRQRGERSVALRGWRLEGPAQPGATIDLTLMWYASSRQTRDWVVFIHLLDAHDRTIIESNRQPRGGVFPTTQWNMGDWIEDQHQIQLPPDLAEGVYTLRIGLYDQQDQRRAGVYALGGAQIGDALDLGSITVQKRKT